MSNKPTLDEDAEIEHLVSQYGKDPRRFIGTIQGKTNARTITESIALEVMRGKAKQTTEDGKAVLTIRVDDLLKLVNDYEAQLIADIIGEPVEPSINGERFEHGKKVTIDLSHNRDESLKFIQENGKAIIQHEQRQRAKERGIDL